MQYGRRAAGSLRLFYAWAVRAGHLAASAAAVAAPSRRPGPVQEGQAVRVEFPELWIEPVAAFLARQRAAGGRIGARRLPDPSRGPGPPRAGRVDRDDGSARLVEWLAGGELVQRAGSRSVRLSGRSTAGRPVQGAWRSSRPRSCPRCGSRASIPRPVTDYVLTAALGAADDKSAAEAHRRLVGFLRG
ncbi:MAG TPA: hypothetical protein VIT42_14130 [Microlunatus sp.]